MQWSGGRRRTKAIGLLLAVALMVFLGFLGKRDVTTSHEARVGQTARMMAASGWPWAAQPATAAAMDVRAADKAGQYAEPRFDLPPVRVNPWLVPVLNGQIRLQKPPLPNWCVATLYRLVGVNEWTTRLVAALLGAIGALMVADLARRLIARAAALPAGLIWASTLVIASEFRETTADPYLAFFTLAAVWAWVRASTGRQSPSFGSRNILIFYASLGLGTLAKGPFVFPHVAIAIVVLWLCGRRSRRPRPRVGWMTHAAGLVLLLAIALPWPLYVATHVQHAKELWKVETTRGGKSMSLLHIVSDSWQFPVRTFEMSLPWTPLWVAGIAGSLLRRGRASRRRRMFPLAWYAATIVIFSFSPEKKLAYLLPMMPAQVLLVTSGAMTLLATVRRGRRHARLAQRFLGAQDVFAVVAVAAALVAFFRAGGGGGHVKSDLAVAVTLAGAAAVLIAISVRGGRTPGRNRLRAWLVPQAVGLAIACLLMDGLTHATSDNARSAKSFASYGARELSPPTNVLVPHLSAEASFYLPLDLMYDPRAREAYDVVEPSHGKKVDLTKYAPELPHGRMTGAEIVPIAGEPPDARWRLVRIRIDPDAATAPSTSPVERPTPGGR